MRKLEQRIYDVADRVILNTSFNRLEVISEFDIADEKAVCLVNGYDPEHLPRPTADSSGDKFRLLYVGGLRGDWFEGWFYKALKVLKSSFPDLYTEFEVHFVGAQFLESKLTHELGIADDIIMHGFVSQSELKRYYSYVTAFLLLLPSSDKPIGWVPQKLYSYLYCNKPIFALIPEGQAADYIRRTQSGIIVHPQQYEKFAEFIAKAIQQFKEGSFHLHRDDVAMSIVRDMARPVLAQKLLQVFEALLRNDYEREG